MSRPLRNLQSGVEMFAELAERSAQQLGRSVRLNGDGGESIRSYSKGLSTLLEPSARMARLTQGLTLDWITFGRSRTERNFDHFNRLLRTPQELLAAQNALIKNNMEEFLARANQLAERSVRMAEEQVKEFSEAAE